MKTSKFSDEPIAYALRQAESATAVADLYRQLGVSEATFYVWKKKFAHLGVSELRRTRSLEEKNTRLKRVIADLTLDKHMMAEAFPKTARCRHSDAPWPGGFRPRSAPVCSTRVSLQDSAGQFGTAPGPQRITRRCAGAFARRSRAPASARAASARCSAVRAGTSTGSARTGSSCN